MPLIRIIVASVLAQCALWGDCPRSAPTSSFVAEALGIQEASSNNAPANIDPILKKDRGVLWRHYYRISAEPAGTLMVAVLEHDYVPTPLEIGADEDKNAPPARKVIESNGDICHITSRLIHAGRTEVVARLQRVSGDWDVLIQYVTDGVTQSAHAARLSDDRLRSYVTKVAAEMGRTRHQE